MGGTGVEIRMGILREAAAQQLLKPFRTLGWDASVGSENQSGEYLIVTATKAGTTRKVALMYSSATSNAHYKTLDALVDHILTNGALYHIDQYAYGIKTPVTPIDEFFPTLIAWNRELTPPAKFPARPPRVRRIRRITAESPAESIWARLNQFASIQLAEKLIRRRAADATIKLDDNQVRAKAAGVAYAIRNSSDYFRSLPFESLNKRVLSLYYGVLAFAFAELLASPHGPADLDEVEGMTKAGHGLYTVESGNGDFGGLHVGALATGFFPRWASFLGHDTSRFPKAKAKTVGDVDKMPTGTVVTMCDLLARLPELGDLFVEVFPTPPAWMVPVFDSDANPNNFRGPRLESTYLLLCDPSRRIAQETIENAGWPFVEVTPAEDQAGEKIFRVRTDHPGYEYWHQALPIHRTPFEGRSALILPVFGGIYEYRAIAFTVLYALSIMVRYMPSAWRRIEGGDWDQHLAMVKTTITVFERMLPEEFLDTITDEDVYAKQPGSLF